MVLRHLELLILIICWKQVQTKETTQFFRCNNGQNILIENLCDTKPDCDDISDENIMLCSNMRCANNKFRCRNGGCIPANSRCDSKVDCLDKSDESQCRDIKKCGNSKFLCISGECIDKSLLCNGKPDCLCESDEFPDICQKRAYSVNDFRCIYGGSIDTFSVCNGYKDCADGSDEDPKMCEASKNTSVKCELPKSNRVFVECQKDNELVDCEERVDVGTIVWRYCKEFYVSSDLNFKAQEAYCQADGRWNNELLQCIPDCGKREDTSNAIPLIIRGWQTEAALWPWHAVLYFQEEHTYTFNCGGTLISERIVITAAHCLWATPIEIMRIGLGKTHSNYTRDADEAIIRDVSRIILQPLYQDLAGQFNSDIGLIVLNESVQFSHTIRPICIDWENKYSDIHLKENSLGAIVGMGVTEENTHSETLMNINLFIQSYEHCRLQMQRDFKKYITYTTFCAGTDNVTGVCNGDSGGGLIFPGVGSENCWTIQGIVSVSPRKRGTNFCDPSYYTIFTKVASFLPWLKHIIYDHVTNGVIEILE